MADTAHDVSTGEFREHWRALLGSTIAVSIGTVGLYSYTTGSFVPSLIEAGYTRSQLSLASLALSGMVALTAPLAGMLMDRHGAIRVIALAVVGEAIGLAVLASIPVSFPVFVASVAMLALLGVGTTPPGFARIVSSRFDRRRGLALGIMIAGAGVTAITAPIWMTSIIGASGWRAGYWSLAGIVLAVGWSGLLIVRSDPSERAAAAIRKQRTGDWSAARRPLFWLIVLAFIAPSLFAGGYLFHMISILRSRGFTAEGAAVIQSMIGFAIVAGRLSSGAAIDRFPAARVAGVILAISALGCLLLLSTSYVVLGLAALAIGLTIGAEQDIMAYLVGRYFGLESFGRLYGLAYSGLMIGAGASPLLISLVSDVWGFDVTFVVSALGTLGGSAILFLMRPPPPLT